MANAKATFAVNPALLELHPGRAGKLKLADSYRKALVDALLHWDRAILPRHFESSAPSRYVGAYQPRTRGYQIRKARMKHHQKPMVWSGTMERTLLATPTVSARVEGSSMKATLTLPFARIANFWAGGRRKHDFGESIRAMTPKEIETLENMIAESVVRAIGDAVNDGERSMTERTHAA